MKSLTKLYEEIHRGDFYHGSAYEFDEFDITKIGTGDEKDKFGWGLYFSTNIEDAKRYADELTLKHHENGNNVYRVRLYNLDDYENWNSNLDYGTKNAILRKLTHNDRHDSYDELKDEFDNYPDD